MTGDATAADTAKPAGARAAAGVFLAFLRLGLTSFGGPVAHLGYFRDEFVVRRRWLVEQSFADLVALCQFLPGPSSSQVGIAVGLSRAGFAGACAAWLGFTLPSALVLAALAIGLQDWRDALHPGLLHGLKLAAVAVVAQAVWTMARTLCPDARRATLAVLSACAVLAWPAAPVQVAVLACAGALGLVLVEPARNAPHESLQIRVPRRLAMAALGAFFALLVLLPLLAARWPDGPVPRIDAFYRAGALVFGGGHVVLPLLQSEVVARGWVGGDVFLAGYGAAQAVPGPLFTFAAFLGASMRSAPAGWAGAALCLVSIFLPGFLLVLGTLPFWDGLRRHGWAQSALGGINAAVVGLLLAALYNPVWTGAVRSPGDFALGLAAWAALALWKLPPWAVVVAAAAAGAALGTP